VGAAEDLPELPAGEGFQDLVVGVVQAVEECVLDPPQCADLHSRADGEAAAWVLDFIADSASGKELPAQELFHVAHAVGEVVTDALMERTVSEEPLRRRPSVLCRIANELGAIPGEIARPLWRATTRLAWLRR
jgi:hypothetical protein